MLTQPFAPERIRWGAPLIMRSSAGYLLGSGPHHSKGPGLFNRQKSDVGKGGYTHFE